MSDDPTWEDPRRALSRHGLAPKRSFSQNFLVSRPAVERIVKAVAPRPGERVVELGPGLGTLTGELLRAGASVVAVERDRDMARVLRADLGGHPRFELLEADAAKVDVVALAEQYGGPVALTGNLPYAITGAILRRLVGWRPALRCAVVMVQREVRDRLLGVPGTKAYGAPTVFIGASFAVERIIDVKRGCFHPPPRVDSAVIRLVPHEVPRAVETEAFRAVVRGIFATRRKTLRNALRIALGNELAGATLAATDFDPRCRGETLTIEEMAQLAAAMEGAANR